MAGDSYNLRSGIHVGISPEEQENPLLLPYISVFATTHEMLSSSSFSISTGMPQWFTQEQVDAIQEANALASAGLRATFKER